MVENPYQPPTTADRQPSPTDHKRASLLRPHFIIAIVAGTLLIAAILALADYWTI